MAPIDTLAEALRNGSGQVGLNAEFLAGNGVSPPPDLDPRLTAAFGLEGPRPTLAVSYDPSRVSAVHDEAFEVPGAHLSFLSYPSAGSDVTLRFAQPSGSFLRIVIEVALLDDWSWPLTFPAVAGRPFDLMTYTDPTFVFSTDSVAKYGWNGGQIELERGLNFVAEVEPDAFRATLGVFEKLAVPSRLTLAGPIDVSRTEYTGRAPAPDLLPFPNMDLAALIVAGKVEVLGDYLSLRDPRIGLRVQAFDLAEEEDGTPLLLPDGTPTTETQQTPLALVAVDLAAGGFDFAMEAPLLEGGLFGLSIRVAADSERQLTPAAAIELIDPHGGASFLEGVPGPLQQLLSRVGLLGLNLGGTLEPELRLLSVGGVIGSIPGARFVLLEDPTGKETIALDSFAVLWTLLNPLGKPAERASSVALTAELKLWPKVFRKLDGSEGGVFDIWIDDTLRVEGSFRGMVTLADLLAGVSGGLVKLPQGVKASFSDVDLLLDPSARTYAFGCTLDAAVDFIQLDGRPLISIEGMRFELGATTPSAGGATAYRGSIAGVIGVGPLALAVTVRYDGAGATPGWELKSALARPLALGELVDDLFDRYQLPDLIPRSLVVKAFAVEATVPAEGSGARSTYAIAGSLAWKIDLLEVEVIAQLGLRYDGAQFSGAAIGEFSFGPDGGPKVRLQVGYAFDAKSTLWIAWEGLRGELEWTPPPDAKKLVRLSAAGWTLGRLVQGLIRGIGSSDFTLEPPWDFLNKISLDGLEIVVDLTTSPATFSASYRIAKIDLGFLVIEGVEFSRGADGKVLIGFKGSSTIDGLNKSGLLPQQGKPASGRDVQNMPPIPGGGTELFELWLLALGQRVSLRGVSAFKDIADAVEKLEAVPSSGGGGNPVDPEQPKPGQPYYDPAAGWLAAIHFGVLKAAGVYMLEGAAVFADPDLYGLRLKFNGEKAKVLDGLELDVLYKKVSDDVGVYQVEFNFPKALRQIDFGAFSVTLPTIGVQIYTNGDFLFDFGFPYNADFSRSFGMSAQIGPVPVVGALGFYFGRVSIGSQAGLPAEYSGTFSPAVVFGVGVTFGVGRYFQKGPLSAGLSITVFGIVEGTIAAWHAAGPTLPAAAVGSSLQSDYFFRLRGSFGIVGKLYGSVDFAVIKAEVNLTISLTASILYESFHDIELSAAASVSVSVSLKIDLGLFSIRISFSFAATIQVDLSIANGGTPPWAPTLDVAQGPVLAAAGPFLAAGGVATTPNFKKVVGVVTPVAVTLHPTPQSTVVPGPDGTPTGLGGAFVFLLAIDAPAADSDDPGSTSFDRLCEVLLPWVIDAYLNPTGTEVELGVVDVQSVSRTQLREIVDRLAGGEGGSPLREEEIEGLLLSQACAVEIVAATEALSDVAVFPPFGGLSLTFPDPAGGGGTKTIGLAEYVTISEEYRVQLAALLRRLAARVEEEAGGKGGVEAERELATDPEPLGRFLFEDWFAIVAQQLLGAGADLIEDFAYPLAPTDSIAAIVAWARERGNPGIGPLDVAAPNATLPLRAGAELPLSGIAATVQAGESLAAVAGRYSDPDPTPRWRTSPEALILANSEARGLVAPGAKIELGGASYTTMPGDSFALVAAGLGVSVAKLAAEATLYPRTDLLVPGRPLAVPSLAYLADGEDTLAGVAARFGLGLDGVAADCEAVEGLFAGESIRIANLDNLLVADVWAALRRDRRPAQVGGMASRFALHGMRLPARRPAGLELPGDFLYPAGEDDYGLYQLSGQQFPTPELIPPPASYAITVAKDAGLDWLRFAGSPTTQELALDLTEPARRLGEVLAWARVNGFDPEATVEAQPQVTREPRRYAVRGAIPWTTSDLARLREIAAPPTLGADSGTAPAQPQALLWELPEALLRGVGDSVARLAAAGMSAGEIAGHLPAVAPYAAGTDPATRQTRLEAIDEFAAATRIQLKVKRLAQEDDLAPQRPDATHIVPPGPGNSGAPSAPLAPYCYEVVSPSPADATLLQQLLSMLGGEHPPAVAGLFLLYEGGPGSAGLASRGGKEMVAFLTQTNLATETAPGLARERAAKLGGGVPRGFLNSPAEAAKLLWELAAVRGGGTYLYYQLPDAGEGLPAAIFDADGVAELTLVIAYDRDPALPAAARVTGAVNAVLTTAPLDLTRVTPVLESAAAISQTRSADSALALGALAALYGVELEALGELNAERELAAIAVPIAGAVHQLSAAEVAAGAYAAVAARYSAGAERPLTAADVEAFNPGMPVAAGRTLRVPPVACLVGSQGAPGRTLAALAGHFGLPVAALVAALADVVAFPPGTRLRLDSRRHELRDRLGVGNAGVAVTRQPPAEPASAPTAAEMDEYARAQLASLFTLLAVGVDGSPFFDASPGALPSAPRKPLTPTEAEAYRHPEQRVEALRADAEEPLAYEATIGFGAAALLNPMPTDASALPPREENPYVGVGSVLELPLEWRDVFGNRAALAAGVAPAAGTVPVQIGYRDQLVGPSRWPNARLHYRYGGSAAAPILTLKLRLDVDSYTDPKTGPAQAGTDARTYATAYWQLAQDYDGAGLTGVSGHAVSMTLSDTLLAQPEMPLDEAQAGEVRGFVASCLEYLLARATGKELPAPAPVELAVPLPGGPRDDDVIALGVSLRLERQALLGDPALRASGDLVETAPVLPDTEGGESEAGEGEVGVSLRSFAESFEKVFVTSGSALRVGTSAVLPGDPASSREVTLWAVRTATAPGGDGIGFNFEGGARFYAPLPPARELRDESAEIDIYESGAKFPARKQTMTFTGADLNAWAQTALAAIDGFLTPTYTAPAFLLDRLTFADPEVEGRLAKILEHKRALAAAIGSSARPVLVEDEPDPAAAAAAAAKLEQALLDRLSTAFSVTAVGVLPAAAAGWKGTVAPGGAPPRFYGQPTATLRKQDLDPGEGNFSLSAAKVPLTVAADGESRLAFLFESRNSAAAAHVPLDLTYAATHLEHEISSVPGIEGYEAGTWISFVTGPVEPLGGTGPLAVDVPVVLRALPKPPSMVGQSATAAVPQPSTPADLGVWDYSFSYLYESAAQDAVEATVEWNTPGSDLFDPDVADAKLFAALAQFVTSWAAVEADLESYLRPLGADAADAPPEAVSALEALEKMSCRLAHAYEAWARGRNAIDAPAAHQPDRVVYEFFLRLEETPAGAARIDVHRLSLQPTDAEVPVPRVKIEGYEERPTPPPPGAEASWIYFDPDGGPLAYEVARQIADRTVALEGLDVFGRQDARSSLLVVRNEEVVPGRETDPDFVFTTPAVSPAEPVVPLLRFDSFPLAGKTTEPLAADLRRFFAELLAGSGSVDVSVKLQASYAYRLAPAIAATPATVLPVALLPPTPFADDTLDDLATKVTDWLAGIADADPGARLIFDLEVFSRSGAARTLPLLALSELWLPRPQPRP